jgi:hypothetical protein
LGESRFLPLNDPLVVVVTTSDSASDSESDSEPDSDSDSESGSDSSSAGPFEATRLSTAPGKVSSGASAPLLSPEESDPEVKEEEEEEEGDCGMAGKALIPQRRRRRRRREEGWEMEKTQEGEETENPNSARQETLILQDRKP